MKPIYLEPDEEITSIIDRLSKVEGSKVAVVVPKNSTMFQSLVNLKLLARQAQKLGKEVAIISNNKVGSRLAKQVGLETYASLGTVASSPVPVAASSPVAEPVGVDTLPDGTPIHRYSPELTDSKISQPAESGEEPAETVAEADVSELTDTQSEDVIVQTEKTEPIAPGTTPGATDDHPVVLSPVRTADDTPSPVSTRPSESSSALPSIVSTGFRSHSEFVFPWKSAIVALSLVVLALVAIFFFLPKATVTLTFPAKLLSDTVTLIAKTTSSTESGIIAGNLLTSEKTLTQEVIATGKRDVGTKSSGTISVKNCEDTNVHSLPAGTKATATLKTFTTGAAVTIPAGTFSGGGTVCTSSPVSVTITASEAGDSYNLANATFTFSGLASRINGTGSTTGGTTKQITVLSQDDVDKAYVTLKAQLQTDATNELKGKVGSQTIIEAAIKQTVLEQKVDKEVGAQVDQATASVTLDLFTIAFDQTAVDEAVKAKLSEKLEANQQLVIPEVLRAVPTFKELSEDKTSLSFELNASGYAAPVIDKKAVAGELNNKTVSNAESFLKDKYQTDEAKIEIIPNWWLKRLPILSQAISIEYGFTEAAPTP